MNVLPKPSGPFASDGEIASKMEEWGDSLAARVADLEAEISRRDTEASRRQDNLLDHLFTGK